MRLKIAEGQVEVGQLLQEKRPRPCGARAEIDNDSLSRFIVWTRLQTLHKRRDERFDRAPSESFDEGKIFDAQIGQHSGYPGLVEKFEEVKSRHAGGSYRGSLGLKVAWAATRGVVILSIDEIFAPSEHYFVSRRALGRVLLVWIAFRTSHASQGVVLPLTWRLFVGWPSLRR